MNLIRTHKEVISNVDNLQIWGVKYTFKSWIVKEPLIDTRTNTYYAPGSLCFVLISYIDELGKFNYVNEEQYFKRVEF